MSPSRAKRGSAAGARPAKPRLAPANKLKREIQAVLTHELADPPNRVGNGRYDGFAYPAAEAYLHLAGADAAGLHPVQLKHRGRSHWWLEDAEGRVVDLTLAGRETSSFPYAGRPLRPCPDDRGAGRSQAWLMPNGRGRYQLRFVRKSSCTYPTTLTGDMKSW